jgi:Mn2+/Fe2+ NRAMP family transporter
MHSTRVKVDTFLPAASLTFPGLLMHQGGTRGVPLAGLPVKVTPGFYLIGLSNFGLDRRLREAKSFYATIAVATLGGVALNFTPIDPVKALYWAAVVNGVLAAPLMAVMMVLAMNPRIMGRLTLPRPMLVVGWLATSVMALAAVVFFLI